jgi:signal transduction histidine kinase/putative methionine-R-sulfoxide reductase with GAF domain
MGETDEIRQYAQFQEALNEITRLALQPLPFAEMLRQLANRTKALFNCDGCYITLWDESQQMTIPTAASDPLGDIYRLIKPAPGEETLTSAALGAEEIVIAEDILSAASRAPKLAQSLPARALLTMPLIAGKRKLGGILIAYDQPHEYTHLEKERAEQLGRQLSLAIAQALLLQQERRQRQLADALREAAAALTSTLNMDQVLDNILVYMAKVVAFDSACIFLRENGNLLAVAAMGLPNPELVIGKLMSITDDALHRIIAETQQPMLLEDVRHDPRFQFWGGSDYVRAWIGLPLRVRGKVIGHLTLDHRQPAAFTPQDAQIALAFADQAAAIIENARLFATEQQRNDKLTVLVNVATILRTAASRHNMLSDILDILLNFLSAQGVSLVLQDHNTKEMVVILAKGVWAKNVNLRAAPEGSVSHRVMKTGQLYLNNNVQGDDIDPRFASTDDATAFKAIVCAPLISEQVGLGAIWVGRLKPFKDQDLEPLITISDMVANALHRDILHEQTERAVVERTAELAAANERLRDLDQLKSKFMADISHELRTPVTNINLYLHLLEKGQSAKSEQYMEVLKGQTARLGQLVEDILSLTRLDIDQRNATLKPLNLNRLIQEAAAIIRPRAQQAGLVLAVALPPDPLTIDGDQNQLQQMFHNLLVNAVNYTPTGKIEVGARLSPEKLGIEAWVADSGPGISEQDLPHIFERFYRGQTTGQSNIPGAGLGLAVVQDIAGIHHGRIAVAKNKMGGTTFTILFPPAPETAVQAPTPVPAKDNDYDNA